MKKRKKARRTERVLLVDGDLICYRLVTCQDFLKETQNDRDEWWEVLQAGQAMDELEARTTEAMKLAGCNSALFAFGSVDNFRKIQVDATYKANRAGKRKPLGFYSFCEKTEELWPRLCVPTLEADDVLGIYHTDNSVCPTETVIWSEDKDMRTLPGYLLAGGEEPQLNFVTEPEALCNWLVQILTGDSSDGYPGCPGIGKVKAARTIDVEVVAELLKRLSWEETAAKLFKNFIVPLFEEKGLSEEDAIRQGRLARILRAGDCDVTAEEVEVRLWNPYDFLEGHFSKARSSKRSKKTRKASQTTQKKTNRGRTST